MSEELKPCPLCGDGYLTGPSTEQIEASSWVGRITCNCCNTEITTAYTEPSEAEAIAEILLAWNRRKAIRTLKKERDMAVEALRVIAGHPYAGTAFANPTTAQVLDSHAMLAKIIERMKGAARATLTQLEASKGEG